MEEMGIPELTSEQRVELCEVAEEAARKYILSKVSSRKISALNITIDIQGTRSTNVSVDVEVALSPSLKNYDAKELTVEATKKAFASIETYLRKIKCTSTEYYP